MIYTVVVASIGDTAAAVVVIGCLCIGVSMCLSFIHHISVHFCVQAPVSFHVSVCLRFSFTHSISLSSPPPSSTPPISPPPLTHTHKKPRLTPDNSCQGSAAPKDARWAGPSHEASRFDVASSGRRGRAPAAAAVDTERSFVVVVVVMVVAVVVVVMVVVIVVVGVGVVEH